MTRARRYIVFLELGLLLVPRVALAADDSEPAPRSVSGDSDGAWEASHNAPGLGGAVGLMRVHSAEMVQPNSFRVALRFQGFSQAPFLFAADGGAGDANTRILSELTIGYQLPNVAFLRHLELYFGLYDSSNKNIRNDAARTDPTVLISLDDFSAGLQGAWKVASPLWIGGNVAARLTPDEWDANSLDFNVFGTLDVRTWKHRVPLRLHVNAGVLVDNTLNSLPSALCPPMVLGDACSRSREVEIFAFGLGTTRVRTAVAIDFPLLWHDRAARIFGFDPFIEYHFDAAISSGDPVVANEIASQQSGSPSTMTNTSVENRYQQYATVGLRVRPGAGLILDVAVDLALQSFGFQFGPPLPAWNIIAGIAYAYDIGGGRSATASSNTMTGRP